MFLINFRSGIEIVTTEIDDLLQQIAELINEFQKEKNTTRVTMREKNIKTSYMKGYESREQSCSSFVNNGKLSNDCA